MLILGYVGLILQVQLAQIRVKYMAPISNGIIRLIFRPVTKKAFPRLCKRVKKRRSLLKFLTLTCIIGKG